MPKRLFETDIFDSYTGHLAGLLTIEETHNGLCSELTINIGGLGVKLNEYQVKNLGEAIEKYLKDNH